MTTKAIRPMPRTGDYRKLSRCLGGREDVSTNMPCNGRDRAVPDCSSPVDIASFRATHFES
jgi:hypothetical protein